MTINCIMGVDEFLDANRLSFHLVNYLRNATAVSKPLTPPPASRRGPPLSPLKRGEGCKAASC